MNSNITRSICLDYGAAKQFSCQIDDERVVATHRAPDALEDVAGAVRLALERPLDFPPLEQALVPGDRLVLAIDSGTPQAAAIVSEVWRVLERRSIDPGDVTILQPQRTDQTEPVDPRGELPIAVRERITWKLHDPGDESERSYLASTATGERVYLARDLVGADFVLPIGPIAFDPVLGYRGTSSVLYPGLSTPDAVDRARGQGHSELRPEDDRLLREMIDEIAWLLGVQFTIQAIAAAGTEASTVLAGAADAVLRRGKQLLGEQWQLELEFRPEIVVAAVDFDAAGHGWQQVGHALAMARNLVAQGGKIIILSELADQPGCGLETIRNSESPRDALKPLRLEAPSDLLTATELAHATDWATVYLLSRLEGDLLEELFLVPLESEREVQRLLSGEEKCAFVGSAQHTHGRVSS